MAKILDVDELLRKNQRVDRNALVEGINAPEAVAPKAPPSSPYSGRRLVVDDRWKFDDVTLRNPRPHVSRKKKLKLTRA